MSDEDDWFERALREDDETEAGDADDGSGESESRGEDESEETALGERSDGTETGDDADEDLFDDDFASAFESAGGAGGMGSGDGGSTPQFGAGGEEGGEFGFGAGAGGGSGEDPFDDEADDSDIPRIAMGVDGLDEMIRGGVPERSLIVTVGAAGTGKTTMGLQFLQEGLQDGGRGVFITLEENRERILQTAEEKGWAFRDAVAAGDLAIVDFDPVEMANSLTSIRNELPGLVEEFDADRLVLDSVSLLEMMYDDQAARRTEIYDFTKSLKAAGVTTLLTSEASESDPYASRHGIIEYLTDAVFVLRYVRPDDFRETRLAIEIQKIRDAHHSRETKPYELTDEGVEVYRQANIF